MSDFMAGEGWALPERHRVILAAYLGAVTDVAPCGPCLLLGSITRRRADASE